jgi:hypothetical protein
VEDLEDKKEAQLVQRIRTEAGRVEHTGVVRGGTWMLPGEIHSLAGL